MGSSDLEAWFVRESTVNAAIVWLLAAVLVGVTALAVYQGILATAILVSIAGIVAIVPPVVHRSWKVTVPWPLLLVVSLPLFFSAARPTLFSVFVIGISVAALAMLLSVVLQMVTPVRMTPGFAVVFVIIVTLATAGFWAVGSAISARYLGTAFVETNDELMVIFTVATLAGLVAGGTFRWYFRRQLAKNPPRSQGETT